VNGLRSRILSKVKKAGNVLSEIESQGFRNKELRFWFSETESNPSGNDLGPE
jgi:hypothetical protein